MKRTLFALIIILLSCAGTEILARVSLKKADFPNHCTERTAAYKDSTYWSPEFMQVSSCGTEPHSARWAYDERGFFHAGNYNSQWVNLRDGQRVTIGQPATYQRSIYLFGSSILAGMGTPDNMTIASHLQVLMPAYRVVNYGVDAQNAKMSLEHMKVVDIQAGDIVVFYHGSNEAAGVYIHAQNRRGSEDGDTLCDIVKWRYKPIATYRLICPDSQAPSAVTVSSRLYADIEDTVQQYKDTVQAARTYVEQRGARFINVLPPNIWSKSLSDYELSLVEVYEDQFDTVFALTWLAMQSTPDTLNFTHILDELRASGREVYFDFVHHNEFASEQIARALAESIGE